MHRVPEITFGHKFRAFAHSPVKCSMIFFWNWIWLQGTKKQNKTKILCVVVLCFRSYLTNSREFLPFEYTTVVNIPLFLLISCDL